MKTIRTINIFFKSVCESKISIHFSYEVSNSTWDLGLYNTYNLLKINIFLQELVSVKLFFFLSRISNCLEGLYLILFSCKKLILFHQLFITNSYFAINHANFFKFNDGWWLKLERNEREKLLMGWLFFSYRTVLNTIVTNNSLWVIYCLDHTTCFSLVHLWKENIVVTCILFALKFEKFTILINIPRVF